MMGFTGSEMAADRVFLFETVARDVSRGRRLPLAGAIVGQALREVPDALVEQPRHHRLFGKLDHAVMHEHRGARSRARHRHGRRRPAPPRLGSAAAEV